MSKATNRTFGDRTLDVELADLRRRIDDLTKKIVAAQLQIQAGTSQGPVGMQWTFAPGIKTSELMPQPVAGTGNPGAIGEASDAGHVHEGLHSLQGLLGDVTLAGSGDNIVSAGGQTITVGRRVSATVPPAIAASGSAGTSAQSANADHTHEGLHALNGLLGDVTLAGAGTVSISTSGQTITITGSSGTSGVTSLNALTGAITLAGGGDNTISASGQTITVGRAVTSTAPPGVAASSNAGTSGVSANADHTHAGVHSIQSLLADVLLAGAGGIAISTSGQTITIDGSGVAGSGGVPTGAILPYGGATAPTGYLMCDGSAVSRTTYSALFAVFGTTYGAGDGSTTFNLPNAKLRFLLGSGTNYPLGATGGQLGHTHGPGTYAVGGNTGAESVDVGVQPAVPPPTTFAAGASHTHSFASVVTGTSAAADPPYLVINFIVKT